MAQAKYQVQLAVDGNHTVSVASDDPVAVTEGLIWAQDTYKKLVKMRQPHQVEGTGTTAPIALQDKPDYSEPGETPVCEVHDVAMVWQKGRKGYFWSCHEKNEDGSWCNFRPRG
jgi:hypothetical protein